MSLIKKIKQFINGSWQEFKLDASTIDNVATQEWVAEQEYAKTSAEVIGEEFQRVGVDWADLIGKDLSSSTLYFDTTKGYGDSGSVSVTVLITTSNGYTLEVGGPPDFYLARSGNQIATFYLSGSNSWPYSEFTLPEDFGTIVSAGGNRPADSCINVLNVYCPIVSLKVEKRVTKLHTQDITLVVPQENGATIATQEWANINLSGQIKWSQDLIDQKRDLSGWMLKFDTNTYYGTENVPGQTWYLAMTSIYSSGGYALSIGGPPNIQLYQNTTLLSLIWQYLSTNAPGVWQMSELILPEDFGYITSIVTATENYFDALNIISPEGFSNNAYAKLNGANTFTGANNITIDPSGTDAIHFVGGIGGDDTAYGMKFESAMRYADTTTYGMGGITIDRFQDYGGQIKHTTKIKFPESSLALPPSSTTTTLTLPNASGILATQDWVGTEVQSLQTKDNLWTGINQFSLANTSIGKRYSADEPYFVCFYDDGMWLTAMKGEQGGDYYWMPSIRLTTMGPPDYTEFKSDRILYSIYNRELGDGSTIDSELILPQGEKGTLATKEWVQAQGYGSGSGDSTPAVYSPIEIQPAQSFTFDTSKIKFGHLYAIIVNANSEMDGDDAGWYNFYAQGMILLTQNSAITVPAICDRLSTVYSDKLIYPNAEITLSHMQMGPTDELRITLSIDGQTSAYFRPSGIQLVEVR